MCESSFKTLSFMSGSGTPVSPGEQADPGSACVDAPPLLHPHVRRRWLPLHCLQPNWPLPGPCVPRPVPALNMFFLCMGHSLNGPFHSSKLCWNIHFFTGSSNLFFVFVLVRAICIFVFILLFNKYLWSTCCVSGPVLGTGIKTVNKMDKPCSHRGYIPVGETNIIICSIIT